MMMSSSQDQQQEKEKEMSTQNVMRTRRNFCVTSFHSTTISVELFNSEAVKHKIKYAVWQRERCPTTGREHWQIYIETTSPQRPAFIQKLLGDPTCYIAERKGTGKQAADYCKKADSRIPDPSGYFGFHEVGEQFDPLSPQKRSDIDEIKNDLENGAKVDEVNAKHWKTARNMQQAIMRARTAYAKEIGQKIRPPIETTVFYGKTRTGKTHRAWMAALKDAGEEMDNVYRLERPTTPGKVWFNQYELATVLIIDEYHDWLFIDQMLSYLDKWPMQIDVKYGSSYACWTKVYITSNLSPANWTYVKKGGAQGAPEKPCPEHFNALLERLTHVYECTSKEEMRLVPNEELLFTFEFNSTTTTSQSASRSPTPDPKRIKL